MSAGKTLASSTDHTIKAGKVKVDGTTYSVKKGKTLIGGTSKDILFQVIEPGKQYLWDVPGTYYWTCPQTGQYSAELHGGGGGGGAGASQGWGSTQGGGGYGSGSAGGGGGGSGNIQSLTLTEGLEYQIVVGAGGEAGSAGASSSGSSHVGTDDGVGGSSTNLKDGGTGGTTYIARVSDDFQIAGCFGGRGGRTTYSPNTDGGGAGSGNLATAGSNGAGSWYNSAGGGSSGGVDGTSKGGQGNKNNSPQTYGDGGNGYPSSSSSANSGSSGKNGAVILTFLGDGSVKMYQHNISVTLDSNGGLATLCITNNSSAQFTTNSLMEYIKSNGNRHPAGGSVTIDGNRYTICAVFVAINYGGGRYDVFGIQLTEPESTSGYDNIPYGCSSVADAVIEL